MFRFAGPLLLFALMATAVHAGDWDALSRVPSKQTVTVEMRDGRQLKGKIREVNPENLVLATASAGANAESQIRLDRAAIARVKRKTRLGPMLIGGGTVGAAGGIGMAFDSSPKDTPAVKALAVLVSVGIGAGVGAAIGHNTTIYEAEARR